MRKANITGKSYSSAWFADGSYNYESDKPNKFGFALHSGGGRLG
jgi:hypothetical protein